MRSGVRRWRCRPCTPRAGAAIPGVRQFVVHRRLLLVVLAAYSFDPISFSRLATVTLLRRRVDAFVIDLRARYFPRVGYPRVPHGFLRQWRWGLARLHLSGSEQRLHHPAPRQVGHSLRHHFPIPCGCVAGSGTGGAGCITSGIGRLQSGCVLILCPRRALRRRQFVVAARQHFGVAADIARRGFPLSVPGSASLLIRSVLGRGMRSSAIICSPTPRRGSLCSLLEVLRQPLILRNVMLRQAPRIDRPARVRAIPFWKTTCATLPSLLSTMTGICPSSNVTLRTTCSARLCAASPPW